MFERYNDHARRVLFFSRYEVTQLGGPSIEPEHVLLGVLRDASQTVVRFAHPGETVETIRRRVELALVPGERVSSSVEIPFSPACKQVLYQAAAEADGLLNKTIGPEHLVLGIVANTTGAAARVLQEAGVEAIAIRAYLGAAADDPAARPSVRTVLTAVGAAGGVVREWKGVVKPGLAADYIRHLHTETLPSLNGLAGFAGATILRRDVEDGIEFQVLTIWRSLGAITAFAGEDVTRAVVPPAAQAFMVRYDERAVHYEIVP